MRSLWKFYQTDCCIQISDNGKVVTDIAKNIHKLLLPPLLDFANGSPHLGLLLCQQFQCSCDFISYNLKYRLQ